MHCAARITRRGRPDWCSPRGAIPWQEQPGASHEVLVPSAFAGRDAQSWACHRLDQDDPASALAGDRFAFAGIAPAVFRRAASPRVSRSCFYLASANQLGLPRMPKDLSLIEARRRRIVGHSSGACVDLYPRDVPDPRVRLLTTWPGKALLRGWPCRGDAHGVWVVLRSVDPTRRVFGRSSDSTHLPLSVWRLKVECFSSTGWPASSEASGARPTVSRQGTRLLGFPAGQPADHAEGCVGPVLPWTLVLFQVCGRSVGPPSAAAEAPRGLGLD